VTDRDDPILPNTRIVARREFVERVRSRPFFASTLLLASLAVFVAFLPVAIRLIDRGTTTTIAIVADDLELADRSATVMGGFLNLADLLRVSPLTIKRWGKRGKLPAIRINSRGDRRYKKEACASQNHPEQLLVCSR